MTLGEALLGLSMVTELIGAVIRFVWWLFT